jgi:hypothetical protein
MNPEAKVVSFVVRFVYEESAAAAPGPARDWHSSIRHVQSDTEQRCARWEEIEAFVARYIDLEKGNGHE